MITSITESNHNQYLQYFQELTELLATHTAENGASCDRFSSDAILQPKYIGEISADEFEKNRYIKITNNEAPYVYETKYADSYEDGAEYGIIEINTLEEVYSLMPNIAEVEAWKRYTRLPLDEPCFTINTNTRSIVVPDEFKNGVAVVGDESSEILYFKVNRYFDSTDLADEKIEIYIQWENAAKDAKGNKITGNSLPYLIDIESEPGYLIFGWPLSSEITAAAGNVTFSVRFFSYDEINPITYSLATQNQTIKILSSLNLPMDSTTEANAINKNEVIKNRLINSSIRNSDGTSSAVEPVFFPDFSLEHYKNKNNVYLMENEVDEIGVEAYTTDTGRISYSWTKYELADDNSTSTSLSTIEYETTMVKTADASAVDNKIYYINIGTEKFPAWSIITGDVLSADLADSEIDVYEKQSVGKITGPGCYSVKAINRVNTSSSEAVTPSFDSTKEGFTDLDKFLVVPHPSAGTIADINASTLELAETAITLNAGARTWGPYKGSETYSWQYSQDGEIYSDISEAVNPAISLTGEFEEVNVPRITLEPLTSDIVLDPQNNNYWKDSNGEAGVLEAVPANETEQIEGLKYYVEVTVEDNKYGYKKPIISNGHAVKDGYYRIKATNSLNTESVSTDYSNAVRVYYPIIRPECIIKNGNTVISDGHQISVGATLSASAQLPDVSGYTESEIVYTYTWYKYNTTRSLVDKFNNVLPSCVARWMAKNGVFEPDPDEVLGYGSEHIISANEAGAYIYCVATATYHGTTATSVATPFVLVIQK